MSEPFDPYYRWLSIPPTEQPPNHYRLLGVALFEQNADVIDLAADRQMLQLRQMQSGPHGAASQPLLNEVAAARACLVDPGRREAYDAVLRRKLARQNHEVSLPAAPALASEQPSLAGFPAPANAGPLFAAAVASRGPARSVLTDRHRAARHRAALWLVPAAVLLVVLLGGGLVAGIYLASTVGSETASADAGHSHVDAERPIAAPSNAVPIHPTVVAPPDSPAPGESPPVSPAAPSPPSVPLEGPNAGPEFLLEATPRRVIQADEHTVHCLQINPDDRQIATGGSEHVIRIWDLETGEQLHTDIAVGGPVKAVAYLGDGKTLAARLLNRTRYSDYDGRSPLAYKTVEKEGEATGLVVSRDGRWMAATDNTGGVALLEATRPTPGSYPRRGWRRYPSSLVGAALSGDSSRCAVFGADGLLATCSVPDCAPQVTLQGHAMTVVGAAYAADGKTLYSVDETGNLRSWDAESGTPIDECRVSEGARALLITRDGASLIVGGDDGAVTAWSAPGLKEQARIDAHRGAITALALTHRGDMLLTAGADGHVRFWRLRSGPHR